MRLQAWMWGAAITILLGAFSVGNLYTTVAAGQEKFDQHIKSNDSDLQDQLVKDRRQWTEIRKIGETLIRLEVLLERMTRDEG
jgi:hypothetical protein